MKYPRNTVWYVEARPWGAPADPPQMGSAVAVRLFRAGDVTSHRKLLLTCAHVVRGKSTDNSEGYGDSLGEFLCWRPGNGYTKAADFGGRQSGKCPGAFTAKISPITPLTPGDVPIADRRPALDWVLLDVEESEFQEMHCVYDLVNVADGDALEIVGYPGGGIGWKTNFLVENLASRDLASTRQGNPGTIRLDAAGKTGPGMSGGGVFNAHGNLVGIHRSQTALELAYGAVAADYIKAELAADGWLVAPSPADDLQGITESSRVLSASVDRLAEMGRDADTSQTIRTALGPLRPTFQRLTTDLTAMQACKEAHEVLLHRAGFKIAHCLLAIKAWQEKPEDVQFGFAVSRLISELTKDALRFEAIAPRCINAYPSATSEAKDFRDAVDSVATLVRQKSPVEADQPIRLVVQPIIRDTPGLLQDVLGRAASQLPFAEIAQAVANSSLDTSPGTPLEGLMELLPLQSVTRRLVSEHLAWQELHKFLRFMEPYVESVSVGKDEAMRDIKVLATTLGRKVQTLQQQETTIGGVDLMLQASSQLQTLSASDTPDITAILNAFLDVQTQADHLFAEADQRLLEACQRLTEIIRPLHQLLAVLPP